MLKTASILIVATFLQLPLGGGQENNPTGVFMQYGHLDDRFQEKGVILRECLLIRSDGRYYLEKRTQHLPETHNTLTSYEGTVDTRSMDELRRVLSEPRFVALPDFVPPEFPLAAAGLKMIIVTLPLGATGRKVGYLRTSQSSTTPSETSPGGYDSQSSAALEPLVSWVAHFESGRLDTVRNGTGSCTLPVSKGG
jgi:hypothetical protein